MELTRAQEQRLAQLEESAAKTNQKLDAIIERLSRLLGNQQSNDQFTLTRSTTPSVKAKGSGSDHFDRSGNDRRVGETREGSVHKAILKENSTPQFQVPMANSELVKSIEPGKIDLGLENDEYVVLNENLEQEWVRKKVKTSFEADDDVGKGQKMISDANICCAHKVFVKMPSKEKHMKHLKAWKFKFKPTSKRSRSMDSVVKPKEISYSHRIAQFHTMLLRLQSKRKQRKDHKSWMFKFKTDYKPARTNHTLHQKRKPSKFPKSWKFKLLVMLQISVNAISGFFDYNNKRMKGTHDERSLFILVDSDSTHNFIYPKIAEKLGCEIKSVGLTRVSVADGNNLGVQWLETLGQINWEFKALEMHFIFKNQRVFLQGIKAGSVKDVKAQRLQKLQENQVQLAMLCVQEFSEEEGRGEPYTLNALAVEEKGNSRIEKLVQEELPDVFLEPKDLPPFGAHHNHKIKLLEGSNLINQRPYRYASRQKNEINTIVEDMLKRVSRVEGAEILHMALSVVECDLLKDIQAAYDSDPAIQVGNDDAEQLKRRRQQKFHKTRQFKFKQQPRRNMVYTPCLRILRRGKEQGRSPQVKLFKNWKFKYKHKHPLRILSCNAQQRRKKRANQQRTEREFPIGDYVLQPYRQNSVVMRENQKLAPKFYGPYKVIDRCDVLVKEPELILARQMVKRQGKAVTKVLVKWMNEPLGSPV